MTHQEDIDEGLAIMKELAALSVENLVTRIADSNKQRLYHEKVQVLGTMMLSVHTTGGDVSKMTERVKKFFDIVKEEMKETDE